MGGIEYKFLEGVQDVVMFLKYTFCSAPHYAKASRGTADDCVPKNEYVVAS